MKKTIRENITNIPYSLHDAEVDQLAVSGKKLMLHFKNCYVQNEEPYDDVKGTVEFEGVDWNCSFAYAFRCKELNLENTGAIEGEKYMLKDFAEGFAGAGFEIIEETFGYNMTKLGGYLYRDGDTLECMIEIYHMGDMSYVTEE